MGSEWEVSAWTYDANIKDFKYVLHYQGNSRQEALETADRLKEDGCKMIKIEWRPA